MKKTIGKILIVISSITLAITLLFALIEMVKQVPWLLVIIIPVWLLIAGAELIK